MSNRIVWIGTAEAAEILGVSESTVYRSLRDDNADQRAEWWGEKDLGWRRKPLSRRGIFQVSRKRAEELAAGRDHDGDPPPADPTS